MRRVLVDYAKAKQRERRGGPQQRLTLDEALLSADESAASILDLDMALNKLSVQDSRKAEIVQLVSFGGLTAEEVVEVVCISTATVNRDLRLARAWLRSELASAAQM